MRWRFLDTSKQWDTANGPMTLVLRLTRSSLFPVVLSNLAFVFLESRTVHKLPAVDLAQDVSTAADLY
jgi:hypothetical protein